MRIAWLILILSAASSFSQSPPACPWLSTGSAMEALGGPVDLDSHLDSDRQGTCRFTRGPVSEQQLISITVGKADTHPCASGSSRVIGLGNEAVECKITSAGGSALEMIAGRVRNIYFVIAAKNLSESEPASPPASYPGYGYTAHTLEHLAEQVVGNLY